jgi:hypothetical protein
MMGVYKGGIEPTSDIKCSEFLDYLNNSFSCSYFALKKRVTFSSGVIIYLPNILFVIKYASLALVSIYFCQTSTVAKLITNADITLRSQRLFFLLRISVFTISSLVYKTIFLYLEFQLQISHEFLIHHRCYVTCILYHGLSCYQYIDIWQMILL